MASDNHAKIVWINVAAFVEHNTFLKKVLFIKNYPVKVPQSYFNSFN